ncbi:MAG: beta-Ala-His dipeptidase [Neisseriaceae bacterium]
MNNSIADLMPSAVWGYFDQICKIPRPSKKEDQIRQFIVYEARALGLEYIITEIGNVVINKPAFSGMENCKKITIQVHMDMVPAKLQSSSHNFETDPIKAYIDGQWVTADGTTLGADNGIGIAFALAILKSKDIKHGPLEILATTDEEAGMTGAFGLNHGEISGDILLNLDSENDTEVCIGCAGGINTEIKLPIKKVNYDKVGKIALKVALDGLYSGHSGVDIHLGRANAIKEIANLMYSLQQIVSFDLCHISGGKLRNVIPAYCEIIIIVENKDKDALIKFIKSFEADLKHEYVKTESRLKLTVSDIQLPDTIIETQTVHNLILALKSCFNGMLEMNWELNIPQTSSNLGVIKSVNNEIEIISLQRSPDAFAKKNLAKQVAAPFELIGAKTFYSGEYPGWLPNLSSEMLGVVTKGYKEIFSQEVKVSATHGGLECGLILDKYSKMDAVSIGPTICDPHSANERVSIKSVDKIWTLLQNILSNTPRK